MSRSTRHIISLIVFAITIFFIGCLGGSQTGIQIATTTSNPITTTLPLTVTSTTPVISTTVGQPTTTNSIPSTTMISETSSSTIPPTTSVTTTSTTTSTSTTKTTRSVRPNVEVIEEILTEGASGEFYIQGRIRNNAPQPVYNVFARLTLYDSSDKVLGGIINTPILSKIDSGVIVTFNTIKTSTLANRVDHYNYTVFWDEPATTPSPTPTPDQIVEIIDETRSLGPSGEFYIQGHIRNNAAKPVYNVQTRLTLYDSFNNVLGPIMNSPPILKLEAGQTISTNVIKSSILSERVDHYTYRVIWTQSP